MAKRKKVRRKPDLVVYQHGRYNKTMYPETKRGETFIEIYGLIRPGSLYDWYGGPPTVATVGTKEMKKWVKVARGAGLVVVTSR